MTDIHIRPMTVDDHAAAYALWSRTEGVGLADADSREGIARFLERNPGMSAVAVDGEGQLVAAVLCGHDGRRGYLQHVAVEPAYRRRGVARQLIDFCFARLAQDGILRCNIFTLPDNHEGIAFWRHNGWDERPWRIFQKSIG